MRYAAKEIQIERKQTGQGKARKISKNTYKTKTTLTFERDKAMFDEHGEHDEIEAERIKERAQLVAEIRNFMLKVRWVSFYITVPNSEDEDKKELAFELDKLEIYSVEQLNLAKEYITGFNKLANMGKSPVRF